MVGGRKHQPRRLVFCGTRPWRKTECVVLRFITAAANYLHVAFEQLTPEIIK